MERSFDLDKAIYEHDSMVQLLKKHGVETIEIRDLLEDSLETEPNHLNILLMTLVAAEQQARVPRDNNPAV
ncbi:MAG: arginine deiminase family protein [Collinsella sp.]